MTGLWRRAAVVAVLGMVSVPGATLGANPPPTVPPPAILPPDGTIAPGVSIDGVPVGGLTVEAARQAVVTQRIAPRRSRLVVSLAGRRMSIDPGKAGYNADVSAAIAAASAYGRTVPAATVDVPLPQTVDLRRLSRVLAYRAHEIEVTPVNATLSFRTARPRVRPPRVGIAIDMTKAAGVVAQAIIARATPSVTLPVKRVRPAKMRVGASVVINRRTLRLTLYREARAVRTLPIAVGTSQYPTPRGLFSIVQKQRNPTWIPPNSPWAKGLGPVPPGRGNPLGTRWMGTSASAVGIHGTPASGSIGTRASHGCIRMYIRDAEWLYERIELGTAVLIV